MDKIVGGVIPQSFRPAVDKGIQEAMLHGELAGAPVQGVTVRLVDGQYHNVDSSEMAFKIAGSMAFKDAYHKAEPMLLEPIMELEVTVPDEAVGAVNGDLNSRRGRLHGMEPLGGLTTIKAEVPMAEVLAYSQSLTSLTGGRGDYSMSFVRYEEVPTHIAQKLIEEAKKAKEESAADPDYRPEPDAGAAQPAVTCAICGRSLLVGEDTTRFSPDGLGTSTSAPFAASRRSRRGGTAKAAPASRPSGRSTPGLLCAAPSGSPPAAQPIAKPMLNRLSPDDQVIVEAAALFNSSSHRRTIEGLTRSLGTPRAAISPAGREAVVIVYWDISWYRYSVIPGEAEPVQMLERGFDATELGIDTIWNADVDAAGRLIPNVVPE